MKIHPAGKTDLADVKLLLDEQHLYHEKICPALFKFPPMDKNNILEILESDEK